MLKSNVKEMSLAAAAGVVMGGEAGAARKKRVNKLIAKIKDDSAEVRTEGWLDAGGFGAAAVKPLAEAMQHKELEVARAAKRALWKIVRHVGRPKARKEKRAVETELVGLLKDEQPVSVRREVLWMLSEIGRRGSVEAMAALLSNKELREDARMALERIPGKQSVKALVEGFESSPEDFKLNMAQSLRKRGQKVRGYSCVKLVPKKKTNVKPIKG